MYGWIFAMIAPSVGLISADIVESRTSAI